MSVKAVLILCAQALLVKSALSQCTSRAAVADVSALGYGYGMGAPYGIGAPGLGYNGLATGYGVNGLGYNGLNAGCGGLGYNGLNAGFGGLGYDGIYAPALEFTATSGGALPVSSASAIAPVGLSVASDNIYEGALAVAGEVPFVGTVGVEGVLPTAGAGAVNHACGNGINAMISETTAFGPGAYGPAALGIAGPFGYGAGLGDLAYPAAGWAGAITPASIAAPGLGYRGGCAGNIGYAY